MKKRLKLKKWVKVVFTVLLFFIGLQIYHNLAILGSIENKTNMVNMFLLLGWFWLVTGQIMTLYWMWEK